MANTKSALKAIRSSEKKAVENLKRTRTYKAARKAVLDAVKEGDVKKAESLLPNAYKAIDKAAKNNAIHKKAAARYKARLVKSIVAAK